MSTAIVPGMTERALWPDGTERVALRGDHVPFALRAPALVPAPQRPVLLVHGYHGHAAEWGPLAALLAERRDVWAPELSTSPGDRGLRGVATQLDEVAARAGGPVDLVGTSLGGYVALRWAATRPEQVASLALLAPAIVPLSPWWRLPGALRLLASRRALDAEERQWRQRLRDRRVEDHLDDTTPHSRDIPVTWRQALLDNERATLASSGADGHRRARHDAVAEMLHAQRRGEIAALFTRPTLWVHGDEDLMVPVREGRALAQALPGVRFEVLTGVGHLPHLERPAAVASLLEAWVSPAAVS